MTQPTTPRTRPGDGTSVEQGLRQAEVVDPSDRGVKPGFQTTELISSLAASAGILIAAAVSDNFQADEAWPLIALLSIGYMLSRGLAKLGAGRHSR